MYYLPVLSEFGVIKFLNISLVSISIVFFPNDTSNAALTTKDITYLCLYDQMMSMCTLLHSVSENSPQVILIAIGH